MRAMLFDLLLNVLKQFQRLVWSIEQVIGGLALQEQYHLDVATIMITRKVILKNLQSGLGLAALI